jgi:hypothetical protein
MPTDETEVILTKPFRAIVLTDSYDDLIDTEDDYGSSVTTTWREDISYGEDNDKEKLKKDKTDKKLKDNKKDPFRDKNK